MSASEPRPWVHGSQVGLTHLLHCTGAGSNLNLAGITLEHPGTCHFDEVPLLCIYNEMQDLDFLHVMHNQNYQNPHHHKLEDSHLDQHGKAGQSVAVPCVHQRQIDQDFRMEAIPCAHELGIFGTWSKECLKQTYRKLAKILGGALLFLVAETMSP